MHRATFRRLGAGVCVVLLGAAASGGAVAAQGSKAEVVKIGLVTSLTGEGITTPEAAAGAQAAVDAYNAKKGPMRLELQACDTKNEASGTQDCLRTLTEDPEVVAIVGALGAEATAAQQILDDAKIPLIGVNAVGLVEMADPLSFPTGGGVLIQFAGTADLALSKGAKTVSVVTVDISAAEIVINAIKATMEAGGGSVVGDPIRISSTTSDLSLAAAQAMKGEPDAILMPLPIQQGVSLMQALSQQGYKGLMINGGQQWTNKTLSDLGIKTKGLAIVTLFPPAEQSGTPATKAFNKDMKKYGKKAVRNEVALNSWEAVQLFISVAEPLETRDRASVLSAANAETAYDTNGLAPEPIDFTAEGSPLPRIFNRNVVFQTAKGKKFTWDGEFHEVDVSL